MSLSIEQILDTMLQYGWSVAINNDYYINDKWHTYYLFTHKTGRYIKSEGCSRHDVLASAFEECLKINEEQLSEKQRWHHVKRGTNYTEIGRGNLQCSTSSPVEGDVMVWYQGDNGLYHCRKASEFDDGRFVEIKSEKRNTSTKETERLENT